MDIEKGIGEDTLRLYKVEFYQGIPGVMEFPGGIDNLPNGQKMACVMEVNDFELALSLLLAIGWTVKVFNQMSDIHKGLGIWGWDGDYKVLRVNCSLQKN